MTKLIVGCGYLGSRVAKLWLDAGQTVFATTRSQSRAKLLRQQNLKPIIADVTVPETLGNLPDIETVLFAVGFDPASGKTRREIFIDGLQNLIRALPSNIQRFIFAGSTSVYGQTDGQWVDENSECLPNTESGRVLLEAEKVLEASQVGHSAIILRIAGLYGLERLHRRTNDLLAGKTIIAVKDHLLNLIHVDDAAKIVIAAENCAFGCQTINGVPINSNLREQAPGLNVILPRTYIVSDGHPVKFCDYISCLANLLNVQTPKIYEPNNSSLLQKRDLSNKLLCNTRMLTELTGELIYPTYVDGLKAGF